jgi:cathepsin L
MKVVVCVLLLACAAFALTEKEYQASFTQWMQKFQRSYAHDEFQYRYRVFRTNLDYINTFNAQNKTMTLGMNQFGDLTNAEYRRMYLGLKMPKNARFPSVHPTPKKVKAPPASWDWNKQGAVTPIKNQEQCGSCWAFSTTGSTEGCHFISTKSLVSLSEQDLVDCSTAQGNQGCDGGLMTQAMDYIISNGGIDTESTYPYTAEDGTCNYNAANSGATLKSYVNVNQGDENDLQLKTYTGPTSVAIDASQSSFQFYSGGVYYEPACSSTQLDHGVLSIGWGTDSSSSSDYWLVKNSWGTSWGLNGFIWMSRNKNNNCGIATMATLPQC